MVCPLLNFAQQKQTVVPTVQNGVSANLATYRAKVISQLHYSLSFMISAVPDEPILSSEELDFNLSDASAPLQIDFKQQTGHGEKITVNKKEIPFKHINEHIIVDPKFLVKGTNKIKIAFITTSSSLNRNHDFLYTLLVPDRARTVFPCFDQPDLKAIFSLTLNVPHDWKVVANAPVKDSVTEVLGTKTVTFLPSDLISTYLFSFVAGKFSQAEQKLNGRTINLYYRETDSAKLKSSINPIFSIQADAIKFMEGYTGIKYPFQKFDCIAIPDFQYGGMEHVGAIQYKASALFLDESATQDQLIARANVLAHETAHMWFGDMVTMRWFNDVWMKEVFANFMADKVGNITLKDNNYALKFLTDHYPAAYGIDRTEGANPIRQPLDNLQDAGSLYGNIIYHKAPIMMRQLERLMGADAFRDGLREYLKKYAYHNASWPELISILDARTPIDLQAWNKVWVNEPGRPQFTYQLKTENGKIKNLIINQKGEDGSPRVWPQYFEITLVYANRTEKLVVNMNMSSLTLKAAEGKAKPLYIIFNSSGEGYGVFPVDAQSVDHLASLKTPLIRASAYINLYENMLNGNTITPARLLKFDQGALLKETEELNVNILLEQLSSIFWRFTPRTKWDEQAPGIENILWQTMQQAKTANQKKLLFKTYSSIAITKTAQNRLYEIWKNKQAPDGIKLTEDDYTSLAGALAIRNYANYQEILNEQLTRIQNPDRKQRLQFLMPSLSNNAAERDAFFESLKEAKNRAKEAWVTAALANLHHPLRTAYSEKYLTQSLDWLADIQLTGDIFFPQSWLQATFNWYQTPTAAATVRKFLKDHPGYNPKLKAKILQSVDNVFRAERLVK
ncbi:MAG: aminopeptidase [Mucilaginibacter sp.]|nr:aminopeptidase [Mucilaginibacter sp.]